MSLKNPIQELENEEDGVINYKPNGAKLVSNPQI